MSSREKKPSGLKWKDCDWQQAQINIRRSWSLGEIGDPKSDASAAPVPMHPLLASYLQAWHGETTYAKPSDWVFPSERCHGRQPRLGGIMAQSYLRPAAVKAGTLAEGDSVRFGFHNLRHSLASFLVCTKTGPKTVQELLRHANVRTTLQLYAKSVSEDRMLASGAMLEAMLLPKTATERTQ